VLRDVTLEVKLSTLGNEAFAALLAAAFDAIAASLRGHAGTESVLLFACTFGWLVSAEAHDRIVGDLSHLLRRGGGTLGGQPQLSMRQCGVF